MKTLVSCLLMTFAACAAWGQSYDMGQIETKLEKEYFKDKNGKIINWLMYESLRWANANAPEPDISVSPDGRDGAKCMRIKCPETGLYAVYLTLETPKPASDYILKFWAKSLLPGSKTQVLYELRGSKHYYKSQDIILTSDWKLHEVVIQIPKLGSEYYQEGKTHDFRFRLWSTVQGSAASDFLGGDVSFKYEGPSCE